MVAGGRPPRSTRTPATAPFLRSLINHAIRFRVKAIMTHQDEYDEAMFDYSMGDFASALRKLEAILSLEPSHFDAQLSVAMCHYRKGDYAAAIAEGHKAEAINPKDQLVHTNLSLFYMKAGDKVRAEHHVAQARMASWKETLAEGAPAGPAAPATPKPPGEARAPKPPPPSKMPWKKPSGAA
jgi:tetratricopeptide (TPR) repeat protein